MNSINTKIYHILRLLLGALFIYASVDKIANPQTFAQAIFNYQILPDYLINIIALLLPWVELLSGCCLIINRWVSGSSFIITILLTGFLSSIFYNLSRGLNISCGCFSTNIEEDAISNLTLYRDILFLAMAFYLFVLTFFKEQMAGKE